MTLRQKKEEELEVAGIIDRLIWRNQKLQILLTGDDPEANGSVGGRRINIGQNCPEISILKPGTG